MTAVDRAGRLEQVQAQVSYHRQRLALHERLHGSAPSVRRYELERAYHAARDRLAACAGDDDPGADGVGLLPPAP